MFVYSLIYIWMYRVVAQYRCYLTVRRSNVTVFHTRTQEKELSATQVISATYIVPAHADDAPPMYTEQPPMYVQAIQLPQVHVPSTKDTGGHGLVMPA